MAIKERLLAQLGTIENDLNQAWNSGEANAWNFVLHRLSEARNLCREGLPKSIYSAYGEVYDGMVLVAEKAAENGLEHVQEDIVLLLSELVRNIMEQSRKEQHFKKEVVFLPYKASMWDSLESVWKAADEDKEHCNAYVIPIPYADKNPDESVADWHCERDMFPKYVPTLDWQQVDLKAWHPDIILIHNPYDKSNHVTSVDSRYYSRNLKECADRLIYIPYFVLGEPELDYDDPEKEEEVQEAEEKIAHFITTPGVLNADRTIVQSEAMKKVYVNVLTRHTNAPREYWEEHILGLGSPKFDKVAEAKKEDYELPEEWAKLIRGRKTILYNTGLTAMLEHTDKYIEKIRSVLETFKAQQDVVLWWRPHPLLRSTFQSMHPELLEAYDEIVNAYRQEGWGIYDDTAELERAIAWTDGYYGDSSSVVQLYEHTGKPVMIQSMELSGMDSFTGRMTFANWTNIGHKIYFIPWLMERVCSIDLDKQELSIEPSIDFKVDDTFAESLFVTKVDNTLIFLPHTGKYFVEHDLVDGLSRKIDLTELCGGLEEADVKISGYAECEDKIFFYCKKPFTIIIKDKASGEYRVMLLSKEISAFLGKDLYNIGQWAQNDDGKFYIVIKETNYVMEIDMEKEIAKIHSVGSEKYSFESIAYGKDCVWLGHSNESCLIKWSPNTGECNEFHCNQMEANVHIRKMVALDNCLVFYGNEGLATQAFLWAVDLADNSMEMFKGTENIKYIDGMGRLDDKYILVSCVYGEETKAYLIDTQMKQVQYLNIEYGNLLRDDIQMEKSGGRSCFLNFLRRSGLALEEGTLLESEVFALKAYIKVLDSFDLKKQSYTSVGRKIIKYIC